MCVDDAAEEVVLLDVLLDEVLADVVAAELNEIMAAAAHAANKNFMMKNQ